MKIILKIAPQIAILVSLWGNSDSTRSNRIFSLPSSAY